MLGLFQAGTLVQCLCYTSHTSLGVARIELTTAERKSFEALHFTSERKKALLHRHVVAVSFASAPVRHARHSHRRNGGFDS